MTVIMRDALNPAGIPGDTPTTTIIAAYEGHDQNPQSYQQAVDRFPGHRIVSIAAHNAVDAQILDVESGATDPHDFATINGWLARQLTRGVTPSIYCNTSTWPSVLPGLTHPAQWWAANWEHGPTIPAGAAGVQYLHPAGYDESIMSDAWVQHLSLAVPIPQPTPVNSSALTYVVKVGDTLSAIAAAHGVTVSMIATWNNIPDPNLIHPGQVLTLHAMAQLVPRETAYTVRPGDTLSGIAARAHQPGVTWQSIARINHLANPNLIRPGQILIIG